jgi:hypothetical protein
LIEAHEASKSDIQAVILNDEIYDRITDDNCPPASEFDIPYEEAEYIGCYLCGRIAGLFVVHDDKMHFMVLKQYRPWASDLLKACFEYRPQSVYVEIPLLYKSVINFAKRNGFVEIYSSGKHLKNGVEYDTKKLIYEV